MGVSLYNKQYADNLNEKIFEECMFLRHEGKYVVGTYCAFTPKEIIVAGGGIPVSLCAGSYESAQKAERDLPRNLCDLIKSSYGHGISDTCPYFHYSDHIIADATCDGKKKMFELLGEIKSMHVLDLPQTYDTEASHKHFKEELLQTVAFIEEKENVSITKAKLNKAIRSYNGLRKSIHKLYQLNLQKPAVVTGREILNISNGISFECNLDKRVKEIETAIKNIEERAKDKNFMSSMANRPRILVTGCPTTHDKLLNVIEEKGGVIVAMENCGGLKTVGDLVEENTKDPIDALTRKYLSVACPCMTPNNKRFDILENLMADYQVDGVIELTWHACHTYNVEAEMVKRFVTDKHIPYLQIETDYSSGDIGQLSTRVEAFMELM